MKFYVTTPIYYVNDRPHIGHVYTTTIADIAARFHRLCGDEVFFLTGTDEHAAKVVDSAAEHGVTPQQWADQNAQAFQETFAKLGITNDDFIRTSQPRHKEKAQQYMAELLKTGDVYLGEYEGWYDAGQEEYLPENKAKEYEFKSPFNGKPLVRKREKNYFFRLSKYSDALLKLLEERPEFVQPDVRRKEVANRIREGLNDIPISRTSEHNWGIRVPGDEAHVIYVWIDALFNYLSAVDNPERQHLWPADVHLIAKDILWFHADRKSIRLNSSHRCISYAVFCLKKKKRISEGAAPAGLWWRGVTPDAARRGVNGRDILSGGGFAGGGPSLFCGGVGFFFFMVGGPLLFPPFPQPAVPGV